MTGPKHRIRLAFKLDAGVKRAVNPLVQDLLRRAHGDRRVSEHLVDKRLGFLFECFCVGSQDVDKAPVEGLLARNALPGENVELSAGQANQPCKPLRAAAPGNHA
ncbi:hypothetical protein D9M72_650980 [compost metagenome]